MDDHILPSPEELAQYKTLDSGIIDYLKIAASKEQDHRHKLDDEYIKLNKREQLFLHGIKILAVIAAFALAALLIWFSYWLITMGHTLEGTIFGGATLVYILYVFISIANNKARPPSA